MRRTWWSDGAVVALLVALRRPDLAARLVLIGQPLNHDGLSPQAQAMTEHLSAESLPPVLAQLYAAVSPDGPEHFGVVFDKLRPEWLAEPSFDLAELAEVKAPTLVMLGDDDMLTVEHAAAVRRAIPDAWLAVVAGASHGLPMQKPDLVARLLLDFLG